MHTQNESRMWFNPDLLETEALKKLRAANLPRIEKIIRQKIKELFFDTGEKQLLLPMRYIKEHILQSGKEDEGYIRKILEEHIGVDRYKNAEGKYDSHWAYLPFFDAEGVLKLNKERCRPYIFERDQFLTPEDYATFAIGEKKEEELVPVPEHRPDIFG